MAYLSILVPVYNELENVPLLHEEIRKAIDPLEIDYEILFVDDGSTDGSRERLQSMASLDSRVRLIQLRRNFGQTAAMQAGLDHARGEVIAFLDADLQNDPRDIPRMLTVLENGFDLVHGWRKDRHDTLITRKIPSRIANWLISKVTHFPVHDLGCTLKLVRSELAHELELCGEMHRFIPILANRRGARCTEMVTNHRTRRFGKSKYGLGRIPRVILDLITVKFLIDYFASPMKLFGRIGLGSIALGSVALMLTLGMKIFSGIDMTGNPFLILGAIALLAGLQFLCMGILGEVNARIYFEGGSKKPYAVRSIQETNVSYDTSPQLRRFPYSRQSA
jgi:glycosyltransferase involved in cell wall biosynthesis